MEPLSLAAIFGPLLVDGAKALIGKYLAPDVFKPANVDEYLKMREFDLRMFEAMNAAGGANPSYPWVEAIVRLMRPGVAAVVIGTWCGLKAYGVESATVDNFASAVAFYLFGDRTLFYSQRAISAQSTRKGV